MVFNFRFSNISIFVVGSICFYMLAFLNSNQYGEAFAFQFPLNLNYNYCQKLSYNRATGTYSSQDSIRGSELTILHAKGRKVPVQFRGGQGKGDIQQQRAQFEEIQKTTETMPVFTVLVRHAGGIPKWYPVAGFQGDGNSKAIVDAYIGDGFFSGVLKDVYRQQIEASISKSVFDQERKLIGDAIKQFPELKKVKFNLEFGFSIAYGPYNRKMGKNPAPTVLKKEMTKSIFQKASENFSLTLKETFGGGKEEE